MAAPSTPSILLSLLFISQLSTHSAKEEPHAHPTCQAFRCNRTDESRFPFSNFTSPECGVHNITFHESIAKIQFEEQGRWYVVKSISSENKTLVIQDAELNDHLSSDICNSLNNLMVLSSHSKYFQVISPTITFLKCKHDHHSLPQHHPKELYNYTRCGAYDLYYLPPTSQHNCSVIKFPMMVLPPCFNLHWNNLSSLLDHVFALQWSPHVDCFFTRLENKSTTSLHAPDTSLNHGDDKRNRRIRKKIIIGVSTGVGCMFLMCLFSFLLSQVISSYTSGQKLWLDNPVFIWKKRTKDAHNVEEFLKNYGSLVLQRYRYSDIKKITNSFKEKLGQGGYGCVFKGKLFDGRLVAVKILNETKGNGEEFVNEVASIGRTYHVNIVTLLGFCSKGSKRALIYEFMPNGSLEKFIYAEKPRTTNHTLGWEKSYQIAVGIARGLEYLHRGCSMRILHLDIKPHNILLDQDFCPKISDFGLAKLCPTKDSIVSMLGARGTVGYIAPEVYCRNFGGVSYKSDVYSYGMMVLEMVGGRKNIDAGVENTSEIYFPQWIYKRLDLNRDLGLHGIATKVEEETARKMIIVGLWCIQADPTNRPSMSGVVEMLEGSLESLEMPPDPVISSVSRSE